jgi:ABC-type cobalt transport system substrate-binding protein
MLGLVGVVIVIVVVVLILLLFRGFGTAAKSGAGATGGKKIVPVEGLTADPGIVSAWVAPGGDVSSILRVAGLESSTITDLGGGRYVISVPAGTEDTVVRILAEVDGVYDAGRVYSSNK